MEKKKKKNPLLMALIALIIVVVVSFMFVVVPYFSAIKPYANYIRYEENGVDVSAKVSRIYVYEDSDDDEQYKIYLSYTYDGVYYEDVYWETTSRDIHRVGNGVDIKIMPDAPTKIRKSDIGGVGFCITVFLYSIILAVVFYEATFYKNKKDCDIQYITDEMITNTLRPRARLSVAYVGIFAAAGMYASHFIIPDLKVSEDVAITVLVAGIIMFFWSLVAVLKIPAKKYKIGVYTCAEKWSEDLNDTTVSHTRFEGISKTNHGGKVFDRAVVGFRYYVILNHAGEVREIYDVTRWRPRVEDESLVKGSRKSALRMCGELILGIIAIGAFAFAFEFVANLLAK